MDTSCLGTVVVSTDHWLPLQEFESERFPEGSLRLKVQGVEAQKLFGLITQNMKCETRLQRVEGWKDGLQGRFPALSGSPPHLLLEL